MNYWLWKGNFIMDNKDKNNIGNQNIGSKWLGKLVFLCFFSTLLFVNSCFEKKHLDFVETGILAPDFTLHNLDRKDVSLSKFKGHITLLHFFSTWNKPSQKALAFYKKMYLKYKPLGLAILGVASLDSPKNVLAYNKKNPFLYQVVMCNELVFDLYKSPKVPTALILDKDGIILRIYKDTKEEDLAIIEDKIKLLTSI